VRRSLQFGSRGSRNLLHCHRYARYPQEPEVVEVRGFKIFLGGAALAALPLLASCSEQQVAAELRSLSGSEDVVFLCRDADGNGHPLSECPDRDTTDDGI